MDAQAAPLTHHLAYLDAATLALHEPQRRQALFCAERGAAWPRYLKALLRPLNAMADAIEAARKRRGKPTKAASLAFVPKRLLGRIEAAHGELREQAVRSSILASSQLVVYAADAVGCLVAAAVTEDALGVVQLDQSLGLTLVALVRCLQVLESYVAGGAPIGLSRPRAAAPRSQQSIALRVALGPRAQARAIGAQRAAAVEGALSRAIYLLVHTYGARAILAAVPSDLRPRLHAFVDELM